MITTSDGTKISTASMGSGTPIVLAHGYASDMNCWNIVANELVVVGTKGVKPTEAHMRTSTHPTDAPTRAPTPHKKVSWRDALFPRQPLVDVDS